MLASFCASEVAGLDADADAFVARGFISKNVFPIVPLRPGNTAKD